MDRHVKWLRRRVIASIATQTVETFVVVAVVAFFLMQWRTGQGPVTSLLGSVVIGQLVAGARLGHAMRNNPLNYVFMRKYVDRPFTYRVSRFQYDDTAHPVAERLPGFTPVATIRDDEADPEPIFDVYHDPSRLVAASVSRASGAISLISSLEDGRILVTDARCLPPHERLVMSLAETDTVEAVVATHRRAISVRPDVVAMASSAHQVVLDSLAIEYDSYLEIGPALSPFLDLEPGKRSWLRLTARIKPEELATLPNRLGPDFSIPTLPSAPTPVAAVPSDRAPQVAAPQVPQVIAPKVPQVAAPQVSGSNVPQVTAPQVFAPQVTAPQVPQVIAPQVAPVIAPQVAQVIAPQVSGSNVPQVTAPQVVAPKIDAADVEAPNVAAAEVATSESAASPPGLSEVVAMEMVTTEDFANADGSREVAPSSPDLSEDFAAPAMASAVAPVADLAAAANALVVFATPFVVAPVEEPAGELDAGPEPMQCTSESAEVEPAVVEPIVTAAPAIAPSRFVTLEPDTDDFDTVTEPITAEVAAVVFTSAPTPNPGQVARQAHAVAQPLMRPATLAEAVVPAPDNAAALTEGVSTDWPPHGPIDTFDVPDLATAFGLSDSEVRSRPRLSTALQAQAGSTAPAPKRSGRTPR